MSFTDIIDSKNKLKYRKLLDYVDLVPQSDFLKEVGMPFLVGKDLYDGHLASKSEGRDTLKFMHVNEVTQGLADGSTNTQPIARIKAASGSQAISHAVYAVRKGPHSLDEAFNEICIGRSTENDISIVDYAISKEHAVLSHSNGVFYIRDLNSTNGVSVNSEKIEAGVDVPIPFGSSINIGRFGLVFARPVDLYNAIKTEVMIEKERGLRA